MNRLDTKTRQKQILNESLNLVKEGGIQNLTIKNISQKVRISEQAIYRHFKSKQDILCAIIKHFNDHFDSVFEEVSSIKPIPVRMNAFIDSHLRYFQNNPATAAVIFSEEIFQYDSKLAKSVNALMDRRIAVVSKFVSSAQGDGLISNDLSTEDVALILLGSMRFMVTSWRLKGFSYNLVERGASLKGTVAKLLF